MDNSTGTRRHRTPDQILGPYFPMDHDPVAQTDLTSIEGVEGLAQGEIIEVAGRVLNLDGEPVRSPLRYGRPTPSAAMRTATIQIQRRWTPTSSVASTFDQTATASIGSKP